MTTYSQTKLSDLLIDIPLNFSKLIDYIIHYDLNDDDIKAWDIIYRLEKSLSNEEEITLILHDFKNRNLIGQPTLLYNALIYGLVNDNNAREILIQKLKNNDHPIFIDYLKTLDTGNNYDGDINVRCILSNLFI